MTELAPMDITILEYVINAGGNATKASMFDDFEPIGPMVWPKLHPRFITEAADGKLTLTELGHKSLKL